MELRGVGMLSCVGRGRAKRPGIAACATFGGGYGIKGMRKAVFLSAVLVCASGAWGTPANKAALDRHFDRFLAKNLNACTTCHLPSDKKDPQNLDEFPHNPFGSRLRAVKKELAAAGKAADIPARIAAVANEDSDGDGIDNLTEILLGH